MGVISSNKHNPPQTWIKLKFYYWSSCPQKSPSRHTLSEGSLRQPADFYVCLQIQQSVALPNDDDDDEVLLTKLPLSPLACVVGPPCPLSFLQLQVQRVLWKRLEPLTRMDVGVVGWEILTTNEMNTALSQFHSLKGGTRVTLIWKKRHNSGFSDRSHFHSNVPLFLSLDRAFPKIGRWMQDNFNVVYSPSIRNS